ncbi:hypothetical protein Agau_P200529 (plasmid) [Agrobacterium tumefaciens F2]|nr:hypothetical protein Agau_P200529 [Agrobacterium tumefaciens F2]
MQVVAVRRKRLPLTTEQEAAFQAFAAKHGRRWKSFVNHVSTDGAPYDESGILRGFETRMARSGSIAIEWGR